MSKDKIKRIDENGKVLTYPTLEMASKDVQSNLEYWKIQLYISQVIDTPRKAFKSQWQRIK